MFMDPTTNHDKGNMATVIGIFENQFQKKIPLNGC